MSCLEGAVGLAVGCGARQASTAWGLCSTESGACRRGPRAREAEEGHLSVCLGQSLHQTRLCASVNVREMEALRAGEDFPS